MTQDKDWSWDFYKVMGYRYMDDELDRFDFNEFMNSAIEERVKKRLNFNIKIKIKQQLKMLFKELKEKCQENREGHRFLCGYQIDYLEEKYLG